MLTINTKNQEFRKPGFRAKCELLYVREKDLYNAAKPKVNVMRASAM